MGNCYDELYHNYLLPIRDCDSGDLINSTASAMVRNLPQSRIRELAFFDQHTYYSILVFPLYGFRQRDLNFSSLEYKMLGHLGVSSPWVRLPSPHHIHHVRP